jgi:8-amino-7-oxononanoate synthase
MADFEDGLQQALAERSRNGLLRRRRILDSAQGVEIQVDGRAMLAFCSNDYLGLANDPRVVEAFRESALAYGVGAGASHLVNGHHREHQRLEEDLAEWTGRPRVTLFSTGYMANLGAVAALLNRDGVVLEDKLNHASLLDAGLLSGAKFLRYSHCDLVKLEERLQQASTRRTLVVTDGVFSMDGDVAPLPEMAALCQRYGAWLMVDDAHGVGTLGASGGGCVEQFGLGVTQVQVLVGTLGKALGTAGAFVAGSEALAETLVQFARPYIYTTAMPPAVAAATRVSLRLAREETWRRAHLQTLIQRFRQEMASMGYQLMASDTAIQPIVVGDAEAALAMSRQLEALGILITAIRPPTVPVGTSRLRVTFSADHSAQHLDRLLDAFQQIRVSRG